MVVFSPSVLKLSRGENFYLPKNFKREREMSLRYKRNLINGYV